MTNILTFKFLRELQKKERASRELEKLDNDFYAQVSSYMEKKTSINLKDNADFAARRDLEHTRIIIRDILNRRERKVINLAVLNARGNIVPKNILPEEKDLFEKIRTAVKDYRSNLEFIFYENKAEKTEDSKLQPTKTVTSHESVKSLTPQGISPRSCEMSESPIRASRLGLEAVASKIEKVPNTIHIRTIDAIPSFVADDGNSYGPFEKGQEIDIPPAAAEILIKIKKAEKL